MSTSDLCLVPRLSFDFPRPECHTTLKDMTVKPCRYLADCDWLVSRAQTDEFWLVRRRDGEERCARAFHPNTPPPDVLRLKARLRKALGEWGTL